MTDFDELARFQPDTALPHEPDTAPKKREEGVRGVCGVRGVVTSLKDEEVDVEDTEVDRDGLGGGRSEGRRGEGGTNVDGV